MGDLKTKACDELERVVEQRHWTEVVEAWLVAFLGFALIYLGAHMWLWVHRGFRVVGL